MPVNLKHYHPEWKERIRPEILKRDNYQCKLCKAKIRSIGIRESDGRFTPLDAFQQEYYKRKK